MTNQTLLKVPFEAEKWRTLDLDDVACSALECSDPTQWIFDGDPVNANYPLQVAVARLLDYRWPRRSGLGFPDYPTLGSDGLNAYVATDGIVCLSSVAGEETGVVRLRALLQAAFGAAYNLGSLLTSSKSATLEEWLRDEFFDEHLRLFEQTPFIWHVWDGRKDGFHALLNYHKLDRKNLEKLIFSYLGEWIARQRQDVHLNVEGSDTRLAAAEHLQGELKKILEGESPHDIFARWKPLDAQPLGWEPDLNDGVRINIRPWITEAKLYKSAKPGILRTTPKLKYTKDRGKEPIRDSAQYPWYENSADRVNDHHLTLRNKRAARESK